MLVYKLNDYSHYEGNTWRRLKERECDGDIACVFKRWVRVKYIEVVLTGGDTYRYFREEPEDDGRNMYDGEEEC